jgi:hypothetical protein
MGPAGQVIEGRAGACGDGGEIGVELEERGEERPLALGDVWEWARGEDHDGVRIRDLVGVSRVVFGI